MKRICMLCLLLLSVRCYAERTITDELGRTVRAPDRPHRLICLMPNVADDIYALGGGDDIVAVSDYTKYPKQAQSKPSIGLPLSPSLETILSLHPDLVVGSGDLNRLDIADRLEHVGIPVFMINPHGMSGIYHSLLSLGFALNREGAATALVAQLRLREAAVRKRVEGQRRVRLFMPIWYEPITTIGRHAFITEIIEIAGGTSITADIAQEWPQVSLESIVARSPDAILLVKGSKMSQQELASRPGWESMNAVKSRRFYYADDRVNYPSPVAFDAMEDLAKQLHP